MVERKIKATMKQRRRETKCKKGINGKEEKKIVERKGIKIDIKKEMRRELLNMKKIRRQGCRTEQQKNIFHHHFFLPERTTLLIE